VRIAVVGAGGVGGYFGGRLAAAGEDVAFLARGAHLEAIRREGLSITSPLGDARIEPVRASADPAEIGPSDLVIVAVKNWSTEEAGRAAARMLAPGGEVVSFQNGVEAWDVLAGLVEAPVLGGVAYIGAWIERPGRIVHMGTLQGLAFGDFEGRSSEAAVRLLSACRQAGIDAEISGDIRRKIWEKFVFLSAHSAMTALARLPIGAIRESPSAWALYGQAIREAAAVAGASGVPISPDAVDRILEFARELRADAGSSLLTDLSRGNRLESPWLCGAVDRMGRAAGLETPVQSMAAAILGLHAGGERPAAGS
jgi:2-dehydropantoate 2-reductase